MNGQYRQLLHAGAWLLLGWSSFGQLVHAQTAIPAIGDNHERLPFHLDSLFALGLVAFAVLVALTMNHRRAAIRTLGLALVALACVCVAGGIFALDWAGQFAEMRPPRYAVDPLKPVVMRVLAFLFLSAGAVLGIVASQQARRRDDLILERRNDTQRYGRVSRFYHWTIAILFLLLVPMGIFTTMIPYDIEYRQVFYVVHKSIGLTVLLLALARVAWLMLTPAPELPAEVMGWERVAARFAHYAFYFFLFAFPVSGFVLGTSLGKLSHFYIWDFPLFWGPDEASLSAARLMHKIILPAAFYLVFVGHVLGAVKHQYLDRRDDYLRRMAT